MSDDVEITPVRPFVARYHWSVVVEQFGTDVRCCMGGWAFTKRGAQRAAERARRGYPLIGGNA